MTHPKLKKRQMIARDHYKQIPNSGDDSMEIWHAVFSTVKMKDSFLKSLEKLCIKKDIRMVLTKQKSNDRIQQG